MILPVNTNCFWFSTISPDLTQNSKRVELLGEGLMRPADSEFTLVL